MCDKKQRQNCTTPPFGWSLDKDQKSLDQSKQIYALAEFKLWNLFKLVDLASVYL